MARPPFVDSLLQAASLQQQALATQAGLTEVARRLPYPRGVEQEAIREVLSGERTSRLYREIIDWLPPPPVGDKTVFFPPLVYVLGVPANWTDAHSSRVDGATVIMFGLGLVALIYGFTRALSTLFVIRGDEQRTPVAGRDDVARWIAYQLDWTSSVAGRPASLIFDPTGEQKAAASDLASEAERFVLCHELSHMLAGHLDRAAAGTLAGGGVAMQIAAPSLEEEFEADAMAFRMIMRASSDGDLDFNKAYGSITLLLRAVDLLEKFGGSSDVDTHPPGLERLRRLQGMVRGAPAEAVNLALQLNRMIDDLAPQVIALTPTAAAEDGSTRGAKAAGDFAELIAQASSANASQALVGQALQILDRQPSVILKLLHDELWRDPEVPEAVMEAGGGGRPKTPQIQLLIELAKTLPQDVQFAVLGAAPT